MGAVSSGFSAACCATRPTEAWQVGSFPELSAKEKEELQTSTNDKAETTAQRAKCNTEWSANAPGWTAAQGDKAPATSTKLPGLAWWSAVAPGQGSKGSTDGAAESTAPSAASEVKDTSAGGGSSWWFSGSSQPAAAPAAVDASVDGPLHKLVLKTFKHPHHCSHCNSFLWGLKDQGYSCQACKKVVCHTCIELPLESLGICTTVPTLQRESSETPTEGSATN